LIQNQRMNQTGKIMRFYVKAVLARKPSRPLVIRNMHKSMKIQFLLFTLISVFILGCSDSSDDRLIGTWISDKDKTLRQFREQGISNDKLYDFLNDNLGKLKITYTPHKAIINFEGTFTEEKYEVLGKDHNSIAIKGKSAFGEDEISILTFDDNYYYTYSELVGYVEYFRKVNQ